LKKRASRKNENRDSQQAGPETGAGSLIKSLRHILRLVKNAD